jgi:flagellar basal-body rod protein FlgF
MTDHRAMDRGLYIAASGMLSEIVRQDTIANELANASTPGYKSDRVSQRSFGDVLLENSATGEQVGPLGLGSRIAEQWTDLSPRGLRTTDEPLDFAIEGEGFFGVQTQQGPRYTRNGQFTVSPRGTLATALGDDVLGRDGAPVRVGADGRVDPAAIGVFAVTGARKEGESYLTGAAAGQAPGSVRPGALEDSGADPLRAMVDMIASLRAFEAGQKVIQSIDSTLAKAAGQVGALS